VTPIKLFFDAATQTAVLNVINNGEEKASVQIEAVEWNQSVNGEDQYAKTNEIIFFPKIFSVEKGEEKIVRIGYKGPSAGTKEKTYRLYLSELPSSKPGETAVKMFLRLGLPIFVSPTQGTVKSSIEKVALFDGGIGITVKNHGNRHVFLNKIKATALIGRDTETFSKEIAGWYVLAGASRTFYTEMPRETCEKSQTIKVIIKAEQQADLTAESVVDWSQCRREREDTRKQ
jgi:fimbrial chaperone protein